jgi:hypothetical protein
MEYIVNCPSGATSVTSSEVVCNVDVSNSVGVLPPISGAELNALIEPMIYIFAMAWGFNMLGKLIFKQA